MGNVCCSINQNKELGRSVIMISQSIEKINNSNQSMADGSGNNAFKTIFVHMVNQQRNTKEQQYESENAVQFIIEHNLNDSDINDSEKMQKIGQEFEPILQDLQKIIDSDSYSYIKLQKQESIKKCDIKNRVILEEQDEKSQNLDEQEQDEGEQKNEKGDNSVQYEEKSDQKSRNEDNEEEEKGNDKKQENILVVQQQQRSPLKNGNANNLFSNNNPSLHNSNTNITNNYENKIGSPKNKGMQQQRIFASTISYLFTASIALQQQNTSSTVPAHPQGKLLNFQVLQQQQNNNNYKGISTSQFKFKVHIQTTPQKLKKCQEYLERKVGKQGGMLENSNIFINYSNSYNNNSLSSISQNQNQSEFTNHNLTTPKQFVSPGTSNYNSSSNNLNNNNNINSNNPSVFHKNVTESVINNQAIQQARSLLQNSRKSMIISKSKTMKTGSFIRDSQSLQQQGTNTNFLEDIAAESRVIIQNNIQLLPQNQEMEFSIGNHIQGIQSNIHYRINLKDKKFICVKTFHSNKFQEYKEEKDKYLELQHEFGHEFKKFGIMMESTNEKTQSIYFKQGLCSLQQFTKKRMEQGIVYKKDELMYIFIFLINFVFYMYSKGYFHGDLKPSNIVLDTVQDAENAAKGSEGHSPHNYNEMGGGDALLMNQKLELKIIDFSGATQHWNTQRVLTPLYFNSFWNVKNLVNACPVFENVEDRLKNEIYSVARVFQSVCVYSQKNHDQLSANFKFKLGHLFQTKENLMKVQQDIRESIFPQYYQNEPDFKKMVDFMTEKIFTFNYSIQEVSDLALELVMFKQQQQQQLYIQNQHQKMYSQNPSVTVTFNSKAFKSPPLTAGSAPTAAANILNHNNNNNLLQQPIEYQINVSPSITFNLPYGITDNDQICELILQEMYNSRKQINRTINTEQIVDPLQQLLLTECFVSSIKCRPEHSQKKMDLNHEIFKFMKSEKKLFLLLGESGSGKTSFLVHLRKQFSQEKRNCHYFRLGQFKDENEFERTINSVYASYPKHQQLIFLLDGFDEIAWQSQELDISISKDIYGHCFEKHAYQSKVILTGRKDFLKNQQQHQHQHHFNNNNNNKQPKKSVDITKSMGISMGVHLSKVVTYHLCEFSHDQINEFIRRFLEAVRQRHRFYQILCFETDQQYFDMFEQFPELNDISSNPLILRILLEILPIMEKKFQKHQQLYYQQLLANNNNTNTNTGNNNFGGSNHNNNNNNNNNNVNFYNSNNFFPAAHKQNNSNTNISARKLSSYNVNNINGKLSQNNSQKNINGNMPQFLMPPNSQRGIVNNNNNNNNNNNLASNSAQNSQRFQSPSSPRAQIMSKQYQQQLRTQQQQQQNQKQLILQTGENNWALLNIYKKKMFQKYFIYKEFTDHWIKYKVEALSTRELRDLIQFKYLFFEDNPHTNITTNNSNDANNHENIVAECILITKAIMKRLTCVLFLNLKQQIFTLKDLQTHLIVNKSHQSNLLQIHYRFFLYLLPVQDYGKKRFSLFPKPIYEFSKASLIVQDLEFLRTKFQEANISIFLVKNQEKEKNPKNENKSKNKIQENKIIKKASVYQLLSEIIAGKQYYLTLTKKLLSIADLQCLRLLAEFYNAQQENEREVLKEMLLLLIQNTQEKEYRNNETNILASNSSTIFNMLGFSFAGLDLKNVWLQGAFLRNAILNKANLSNADLTGADLTDSYLIDANLNGTNLENVQFGKMPSFLDHFGSKVMDIAISQNGLYVASADQRNTVLVWQLNSHKIVKKVRFFDFPVTGILFSPDSEFLMISQDGNDEKGMPVLIAIKRFYASESQSKQEEEEEGGDSNQQEKKKSQNKKSNAVIQKQSNSNTSVFQEDRYKKFQQEASNFKAYTKIQRVNQEIMKMQQENPMQIYQNAKQQQQIQVSGKQLSVQNITEMQYQCNIAFSEAGTYFGCVSQYGTEIWKNNFHSSNVNKFEDTFTKSWLVPGADGTHIDFATGEENFVVSGGKATDRVKIWNIEQRQLLFNVSDFNNSIGMVVFSPRGSQIAGIFTQQGYTVNLIKLWSVTETKVEKKLRGHDHIISCIRYANEGNGKYLISASIDSQVIVWNVDTQEQLQSFVLNTLPITCISISACDNYATNYMFSASEDGYINYWLLVDIIEKQESKYESVKGINDHISVLQNTPKNNIIVGFKNSETSKIYNYKTGDQIGEIMNPSQESAQQITSINYSQRYQMMLIADNESLVIYNTEHYEQIDQVSVIQSENVGNAVLSPTQPYFVFADAGKYIRIYNLENAKRNNQLRQQYMQQLYNDNSSAFSSSNNLNMNMNNNNSQNKNQNQMNNPNVEKSPKNNNSNIDRSPRSQTNNNSSSRDDIKKRRMTRTSILINPMQAPVEKTIVDIQIVTNVVFSNDGEYLVTFNASENHLVNIRSDNQYDAKNTFFIKNNAASNVKTEDFSLRVWSFQSLIQEESSCFLNNLCCFGKKKNNKNQKKLLAHLKGEHNQTIKCAEFSPDNQYLASGGKEGIVVIWDWAKKRKESELTNPQLFSISTMSFTKHNCHLAVGGEQFDVFIFNVKYSSLVTVLKGHQNNVTSLLYSPDGNTLFAGSDDCSLSIYSVVDNGNRDLLSAPLQENNTNYCNDDSKIQQNQQKKRRNYEVVDEIIQNQENSKLKSQNQQPWLSYSPTNQLKQSELGLKNKANSIFLDKNNNPIPNSSGTEEDSYFLQSVITQNTMKLNCEGLQFKGALNLSSANFLMLQQQNPEFFIRFEEQKLNNMSSIELQHKVMTYNHNINDFNYDSINQDENNNNNSKTQDSK